MILLMTMAVLLPLLAALQYYWLGQVSKGASERLQSSLQAGATRFRQDFNREFIRAYLNFQIDSLAPPDDISQNLLERLETWQRSAPYPQLVSAVFLVDYDEEDRPRLNQVNTNAKRLEVVEWSGELGRMRERFEKRSGSSAGAPLESFDESIPALIVPIPDLETKESEEGSPRPAGFTVIKLDLNYLQREFIPSLVKRHLFENADEYNLAVVSIRNPERIIYSSGSSATDFSSSDVSTRVFGLEPDELQAFMRTEGAPTAGAGQRSTRMRLNLRYLKGPPLQSATASGKEDGRWQLLIKHQAGSLAAAVSSVRRRNLAISFGILLLLATGILMTAISMKRAERLARQQINFVAGVTHELRTPLAVICSAGENLADGIVDSPRKVADYGEIIHREGRRLADMVEQVLEFAGAQSESRRYDLRATKVADFIGEALLACDTQLQERDFKVETIVEPNLPLVRGDAVALKQVMQNLITNAIKYAGDSRFARISAQTYPAKQGHLVRILIEDRGVGISKAEIKHIFEPFYRGRAALAAQIAGSGVGLSIVKQIVAAHGGEISVKSTPGSGTVFTLDLPIASEQTDISGEVVSVPPAVAGGFMRIRHDE